MAYNPFGAAAMNNGGTTPQDGTSTMSGWWNQPQAQANQFYDPMSLSPFQGTQQQQPAGQAPNNMAAYVAAGGDPMSQSGYRDWNNQQTRENTLAGFVDRMADPQAREVSGTLKANLGTASGAVNDWIATPKPVMNEGNRYEPGLSQAESRLNNLLTNTGELGQSAAYKFRVQQANEAMNRSLGAKGLLNSGNRITATADLNQGLASQEYGDEYGRRKALLDSYAGNWNTDKQANTNRFGVENTAYNQRGAVLGDLLKGAGSNYTTNIGADNNNRVNWANAWTNQAPKATPLTPQATSMGPRTTKYI